MDKGPPPSYADTTQEGCYNNQGFQPPMSGYSTQPAYPTGQDKSAGPGAYSPPNVYYTSAPPPGQQQVMVGAPAVVLQIEPAPQNYMLLSIMVCLFCNCLFGLVAIFFSSSSGDAAKQGRMEEARSKAKTALIINVVGVSMSAMVIVAGVILVSVANS